LVYAHKPQRSGRSITANTNNTPQDPPPPPKILDDVKQIPDILIENFTPPVPEICTTQDIPTPKKVTPIKPIKKVKPVEKTIPQKSVTKKISRIRRIFSKLFFWRK